MGHLEAMNTSYSSLIRFQNNNGNDEEDDITSNNKRCFQKSRVHSNQLQMRGGCCVINSASRETVYCGWFHDAFLRSLQISSVQYKFLMKSAAPVCFMDGTTPPSFSCDPLIIKGGRRKPLHKSEHQVPIQLISVVNSHFSHLRSPRCS